MVSLVGNGRKRTGDQRVWAFQFIVSERLTNTETLSSCAQTKSHRIIEVPLINPPCLPCHHRDGLTTPQQAFPSETLRNGMEAPAVWMLPYNPPWTWTKDSRRGCGMLSRSRMRELRAWRPSIGGWPRSSLGRVK
jgi:hypothetical protein